MTKVKKFSQILFGAIVMLQLPNPKLTPGKIDLLATKEKVCEAGYSKSVRHVSRKTKLNVFSKYGIPFQKGYEVDHLISLELGGNNDEENLWPEFYCPLPHKKGCYGAREKDVVENLLHHMVCMGKISLAEAQHKIYMDWVGEYKRLREEPFK